MTNYEKVREEVVRAVPEIMKLEFGCEIKWRQEVWRYVCHGRRPDGENTLMIIGDNKVANINEKEEIRLSTDSYEILGRPITIADVLRAMNVKHKEEYSKSLYKVDDELLVGLIEKFDLTKDLSGQSEECLSFLAGILTEK